jgi:RNA polymerase sigma-70 factor, ECF subfamily
MAISDDLRHYSGEQRPDLIRFAALQLRDPALAEDVVQETLVAAEQGFEQFAGRSSIKTWVFSILKRKIVDALRTRLREVPVSQMGNSDDGGLDELFDQRGFWATEHRPHRWTDPEESLEQQQFWQIFELCLDGLPERTARVFSMRELLGLETDEICKELSISTSNCWVILHRARMGLRLCLEERWFARGRLAENRS